MTEYHRSPPTQKALPLPTGRLTIAEPGGGPGKGRRVGRRRRGQPSETAELAGYDEPLRLFPLLPRRRRKIQSAWPGGSLGHRRKHFALIHLG